MALQIEEIFPYELQQEARTLLELQLLSLLEQRNRDQALLKFMSAYARYNANFPGAICALVAAITNFPGLEDPTEPLEILQDRRHQMASYVFEAARDEFAGATHRGLAQQTIRGMLEFFGPGAANVALQTPWLDSISRFIRSSYEPTSQSKKALFQALGFHLASEYYASFEFSILDFFLDEYFPELRKHLVAQGAYGWIAAHSCFGDDVELAHYQAAVKGIECAERYLPTLDWVEQLRIGADKFGEQWRLFVKWAGR